MNSHWEAISIHMLTSPTSGLALSPPVSIDPQLVTAMANQQLIKARTIFSFQEFENPLLLGTASSSSLAAGDEPSTSSLEPYVPVAIPATFRSSLFCVDEVATPASSCSLTRKGGRAQPEIVLEHDCVRGAM